MLINDNPGGCGNDLAIDDIQFRPCGPDIVLEMGETLKQADTLFFCEGATGPIRMGSAMSSNDSYAATPAFQWQTRRNEETEWQDIPGENNYELVVVPIHNQWYRLSAAASTSNLDNRLCRITSDAVRLAQITPQADVSDINVLGPLCGTDAIQLDPPEYSAENAGPVTYQWQLDEGNGPVDIPDAHSSTYVFPLDAPRTVLLQRQVINACGDRFTTHIYEIEARETIHTTLTLPQSTICADEQPLRLVGGQIVNGEGNIEGIYRGNGVSNGYFYPSIAGVGQHTITFSPPDDTVCGEPSQATLTVYDTVYIDPMEDIVMIPGQQITLHPQTNASQFSWSNQPGLDDYYTQYPVASPSETTTYILTASNAAGCTKTAAITITVLQNLRVPNSFTPNGDGINDTWEIDGLQGYPDVFVQVFNRWGTLVFSSKGYLTPWNGQSHGRQLPAGTYYYTIAADLLEQPLAGSVSILK